MKCLAWLTMVSFFLATSIGMAASVPKSDVLKAIESDPIGAAALKEASAKDCKSELTKVPTKTYSQFVVTLTCDDSAISDTGGVYLGISIEGTYFDAGFGEVTSLRIHRAG